MPTETTAGEVRKPGRDAEATRKAILVAGRAEFAEAGLGGGRIDAIAERAGCNKAMIYHYFGSKTALFSAVLEHNYALIREAERALDLDDLPPLEAVRKLVAFSFDYVRENPEFIKLINEENLHGGVHLASSPTARSLNSPLVGMLRQILDRGEREGTVRAGVDAQHLYIDIASICYFSVSNRHTLGAIFDLPEGDALLAERRTHVIEVILGYLRPDPDVDERTAPC